MNEALAQVAVPTDRAAAAAIWDAYSPRWQTWNVVRTAASGLALLLAGWAGMRRWRVIIHPMTSSSPAAARPVLV